MALATQDRSHAASGPSEAPLCLAVIPARGGSKGVPRKNIRKLGDRPLIAHTIDCAMRARDCFHRILVTTDDPEIAETAQQWGAEAPFLRSADLAADSTPMLPVLQDCVRRVEEEDGVRLALVMLLQPTVPFRAPEDISACLALAQQDPACSSVISVCQVFSHHPILMKRIEDGVLKPYCIEEREGTRRQEYDPPAYMRNGAIYLTRRDVLMDDGSIWGDRIRPYPMPEERSVNIDSFLDFAAAEALVSASNRQPPR